MGAVEGRGLRSAQHVCVGAEGLVHREGVASVDALSARRCDLVRGCARCAARGSAQDNCTRQGAWTAFAPLGDQLLRVQASFAC